MIERDDRGRVSVLRLARGKGNSMNLEFLAAIAAALDEAEARATTGALVLTGMGSVFSAGVDLMELSRGGAAYVGRFIPALRAAFERLFLFPKPVVAAVNGHAIAGGCVTCLACDYRIMASGSGKIGLTELPVGVPFPPLVLEIVRAALAPHVYPRVVNLGQLFPAEEARELGMVDEVTDPEVLLERAAEIADRLAAVPFDSFRLTKLANRQLAMDAARRADERFLPAIEAAWASPAVGEAIRAFIAKNIARA